MDQELKLMARYHEAYKLIERMKKQMLRAQLNEADVYSNPYRAAIADAIKFLKEDDNETAL